MVKRLLVLLMAVGAMFVGAIAFVALPAHADAISVAKGKLSPDNPVYVAPDAAVTVKSDAVAGADNVPIAVAALPSSVGDPDKVASQLGLAVFGRDTKGVMIVFSGTQAGSANGFTGQVHGEINQVSQSVKQKDQLAKGGDASGFVQDVVSGINEAKAADESKSGGNGAGTDSKGGGHTGLIVFLVIVLLVVGGVGAWVVTKRRRKRQHLADRRAEVVSYYDRLGADVQNLYAGDDEVTQQALADAAERYTATGALLARADSDAQFDSARRTALEGLQAARTARLRLGLDAGPDLPPISPTRGEKLTEAQEYQVGDRTVRGHPDYEPGAPYYYGGGGGYGAGWYSFPFWETLLLSSALSGGMGGWGGGGFDSGYDQGYEAGEDHANDQNGDSGGGDNSGWGSGGDNSGWGSGGDNSGWDSSGGGWDSGGSDWGGDSGGGGDWGGGGGDGGW